MDQVTLLIDGDIICYEAASAVEQEIQWDDDLWTLHSNLDEAKRLVEDKLLGWQERFSADTVIAFSDSANFRKTIFPNYKMNRKAKRKPIVYKPLKQWMEGVWESYQRPGLEGDDVLGILATHPKALRGQKIIVSIDKDMKTIPGYVWNPDKDVEPVFIYPDEADYMHLYQTLTGDATDGYPGLPGCGPKGAEKVLEEPTWKAVVEAYAKKGLTEEDALVQARCARILRYTDYDFKNKEVKLWLPTERT
jgi:DNA polymerase-1